MLPMLLALVAQPSFPPACAEAPSVCEAPLPPERELRALLRSRQQAWRIRNGILTIVARDDPPARLCCALQSPLRSVAPGLQALSLRVPDIESAVIDIRILRGTEWPEAETYRGPRAERAPPQLPVDRDRLTVHDIASRHLGEHRSVQVYLPPDLPRNARLPIVYLGDGLSRDLAGIAEALWQRRETAPFILVGISSSPHHGDFSCAPRCDGRSREYLIDIPDMPAEESRFEAHARFVIEEVVPLVEAGFPVSTRPEDRLIAGYSSGSAWALTMAARHPDVFRGGILMSLGWLPAAFEAKKLRRGRFFFGGGRLEDRFHLRTVEAANAATRAGAQVRLRTPNAGHSFDNWSILFADALRWHFPAER